MGCWSCTHWAPERGKELWKTKRLSDLATAVRLATESPDGEQAIPVVNIRRMVSQMDHAMAKPVPVFGVCMSGHIETDFVSNSYLCDRWTGAAGASLARAGQKADTLPEELMEQVFAEAEKGDKTS